MIMFRKLRWKNFLSTGNIFTEIELDKNSSTLIIGENGSGKSTILDALSFSLFGKPFRKINKGQLVNSITNKQLVTEIEFDISPNSYKIIRGIKPNVFEIYVNGNLMNQSAEMKDYQEFLERQVLKINQKSFNQVVVLGSATFQPFMQLSTGHRREIIEDLLDLQIFTTMNQLLKDKVSNNNNSIADIQTEQRVFNEKIKLLKEHLRGAQIDNEEIIQEKNKCIQETEVKIAKCKEDIDYLQTKVSELNVKLENKDSINNRLEKIKKLKMQLEHKMDHLKDDIKFFEDNEHCPVCKQQIDEQFKNNSIDQKKNQLSDVENSIPKLLKEYEHANNQLDELLTINNSITDLKMQIHEYKYNLKSYIEYSEELQNEINRISTKIKNEDKSNIDKMEKELKSLEKKYIELTNDKAVLAAASSMLKDGGIKARIIKQYVPVINKLINKYLSAMDFFVAFELDEEFNETIKSRYRDEFSYASFSEGEKMRINLAILFTWRAVAKLRNSINTNLLIMDEVFDSSLDSNGTEEFLKIINELTADTNTFIISHKGDQLIDKFTNILRFTKHKNFSKIA